MDLAHEFSKVGNDVFDDVMGLTIEEEIEGIDGIDKIRSSALEGACSVIVELLSGADQAQVLDDVKARVDAIWGELGIF